MAKIKTRKHGYGESYQIAFTLAGKEKTLSLDRKYTRRHAEEIALYVQKAADAIETGSSPDRPTQAWLDDMTDDLRKRFVNAGLIEETETLDAWELWERFTTEADRNPKRKPSTVRSYGVAQKRFFGYFPRHTPVDEITSEEGFAWRESMKESGLAEATIAGTIKITRAVFRWGVEKEYCRTNVFKKVERGSFVNKAKRQFISMEWYRKLLDSCPDQTWRTLLALCRIGGLRSTSETLAVRWEDVDWEKKRLLVRSSKTERHFGKESRVIPLFPEMRVELEKQFDQAEEGGSPYIIDRWRESEANLRTQFSRIIFRAGLQQWADPFQNLRRSRDIELSTRYPAHVAAEWMGHSPKVAEKHYLFATDDDFRNALEEPQRPELLEHCTKEVLK